MAATTIAPETTRAVRELAQFIADTGFDDLPQSTVARAKLVVADTIGVALAGSLELEMQRLYDRLPAGTGARLLRRGFDEAAPPVAALANATATSFLELDEGSRPTGHPALHIVPPALALAQATRRSGREFLVAIVLGYEVQARLAKACKLRWPVHPHGNLGQPAATATLGKLAGWSPGQFEQGMNAAASLATATSWSSCFEGATTRNAYAGITAQTAFTVKMLVESGFTASGIAFTDTFGTILADDFRPTALVEALGEEFAITRGYFKFHAACALVHPVLEALGQALGATRVPGRYPPAVAREELAPEEIRRIRVSVSERGALLAGLNRPNQLSAKFSVPYAAAAFVLRGTSAPESFRAPTLTDEHVQELARRVEVESSAELSERWPEEFAANVEIELSDGRRLGGTCTNPYGSGDQTASEEDLRAKFASLSAAVLTQDEQDDLWEQACSLETADEVTLFPGNH